MAKADSLSQRGLRYWSNVKYADRLTADKEMYSHSDRGIIRIRRTNGNPDNSIVKGAFQLINDANEAIIKVYLARGSLNMNRILSLLCRITHSASQQESESNTNSIAT